MKLICPDCGKQYDSGKFCPECGGKLQEIVPELVCPSCGYKAKSGKFCPECGTKLTEQVVGESKAILERKFNEKDPRFAKYYDKKGFPRTIPQEERAVAIEELTPFVEQNVAEAKMLLGYIMCNNQEFQGMHLIKEAEEDGNKLAYYLMGICYYGFDMIEQDHNEAEKRLLEAYDEYQDAGIAGLLAELYTFSDEKCDYAKALEYATIAAEDDDQTGYNVLGTLYLNGWGVEENIQLALENYKMAAAFGEEVAMSQIGFIYMGSENFESDSKQAFYWFNEAAQKGSDVGMNNLGYCYANGIGVERDMEKAAEWYKKAAEAGYVDAMLKLGFYYQQVLVDKRKSEEWFRKAAESGSTDAMIELGFWGDFKDDDSKAFEWFQKAADKGNVAALKHLAGCYLNGRGVPVNLQKACEILNEAVESGDDSAVYELVKVFENGYGTNQDKEKAFALYIDAAEEGDATAMRCLGICLINGFGTEVNLSEGRKWLTRADEEGDYVAADILGNLDEEITFDEENDELPEEENNPTHQDRMNDANTIALQEKYLRLEKQIFAEVNKFNSMKGSKYFCKIAYDSYSISIGNFAQLSNLGIGGAFKAGFYEQEMRNQYDYIMTLINGLKELAESQDFVEANKKNATKAGAQTTKTVKALGLPMDEIKKASKANYPKHSLKALAIATLKIAEVIEERLPDVEVSYMVHPSEFDRNVHPDALPIHFLFKKNGVPKVAVVAVSKYGYKTPLVLETRTACLDNGIGYVRVYAEGPYADWIQGWSEFYPYDAYNHGHVSKKQVEFCKNWLVEQISAWL